MSEEHTGKRGNMKTKEFVALIAAFLVLGGTIGGAFIGGIAVGERRGQNAAQSQLTPQATASNRNQTQSQFTRPGQSATSQGASNSGGITGTIDKVEGNIVTVNTARGPVQASLGQDTVIQKSSPGSANDLKPGVQLTVVGQRSNDGTIQARSIQLMPEGGTGLGGLRTPRPSPTPQATP